MILKEHAFAKIRQDAENYKGQELHFKYNVGRNKVENLTGVIEGVYSDKFKIRRTDICAPATFSYADILTNSLEVTSLDGEEQLLSYEFDTSKKIVQL